MDVVERSKVELEAEEEEEDYDLDMTEEDLMAVEDQFDEEDDLGKVVNVEEEKKRRKIELDGKGHWREKTTATSLEKSSEPFLVLDQYLGWTGTRVDAHAKPSNRLAPSHSVDETEKLKYMSLATPFKVIEDLEPIEPAKISFRTAEAIGQMKLGVSPRSFDPSGGSIAEMLSEIEQETEAAEPGAIKKAAGAVKKAVQRFVPGGK